MFKFDQRLELSWTTQSHSLSQAIDLNDEREFEEFEEWVEFLHFYFSER